MKHNIVIIWATFMMFITSLYTIYGLGVALFGTCNETIGLTTLSCAVLSLILGIVIYNETA